MAANGSDVYALRQHGEEILIKQLAVWSVVLAAIAGVAAGCGDDEQAKGVTTSSMSKAEYVKGANEVCTESKEKSSKKALSILNSDPAQQKALRAEFIDIAIEHTQAQIDEIRDLGAPAGSEDQVEAILLAMQRGVDESQKKNIESSERLAKEFERFDEMAREYGLTSCVVGF